MAVYAPALLFEVRVEDLVVTQLHGERLRVGTDGVSHVDLVLSLVEVLQKLVDLTQRLRQHVANSSCCHV